MTEEGWRIDRALIDRKGSGFPPSRYIRIGVCPLYTKFEKLHVVAMALRRVVEERLYEQYPTEAAGVT